MDPIRLSTFVRSVVLVKSVVHPPTHMQDAQFQILTSVDILTLLHERVLKLEAHCFNLNAPACTVSSIPLLIDSLDKSVLESYRKRIKTDKVLTCNVQGFKIVFDLTFFEPANYVRAIQELEMLKTRVMDVDGRTKKAVQRPSFVDVWCKNSRFREMITNSADPHEQKWLLSKKFGYKMANNFVPMYARSIFDYFHAKSVLDPCAGWGDRVAGALSSATVQKYVGFDPNLNLIPGYKRILGDFGSGVRAQDATTIHFDNGYVMHSARFETGRGMLDGLMFDFAFTGPPYFDYEDYGEYMPVYKDWVQEFYRPLFEITHDHLHPNGIFAIYINDCIAGKIWATYTMRSLS